MTKFEKNENVRAYSMVHVEQMINYLQSRGYQIKLFKELKSNEFIISFDSLTCNCRSCRDVCETLEALFERERTEAFKEYVNKKMLEVFK